MKKVFEIEWDDDDIILDAEKVKNCLNSVIHYNAYTTNVIELAQESECKCYSKFEPGQQIPVDNIQRMICSKCKLPIKTEPKKIEKLIVHDKDGDHLFSMETVIDKINEIIDELEAK